MVGGQTSFGSGRYDQTVWDALLPVDMSPGASGHGWESIRMAVTRDGYRHPIFKVLPDTRANRRALRKLPTLYGTNFVGRLKPGAVALCEHPTRRIATGPMPMIAVQPSGRGRSMAFTSDTTFAWGRDFERRWGEGDNRYFRKFWQNVCRWLAAGKTGHAGARLRLRLPRHSYHAGDVIELDVTALDDEARPSTDYEVRVSIRGHEPRDARDAGTASAPALVLTPQPSQSTYAGRLVVPRGLRGRAELYAELLDGGTRIDEVRVPLRVVGDLFEVTNPTPDRKRLRSLATITGGSVLDDARAVLALLDHETARETTQTVRYVPAWNRTWLLLALLAFLTLDWVSRRRMNAG